MKTLAAAVIAILMCACGGSPDETGGTGGSGDEETGGAGGAGGSTEVVTPHIPGPKAPDVGPCGVVPNADYCACALECPDPVVVDNGVVSGSPDCWGKTCSQGACGVVALPPGQPCAEGVCDGAGLCVDKLPE